MAVVEENRITVDVKFEKVVELDKAGKELLFDSKPGKFKELSEAEIKQLSTRNRQSYQISKQMWEDRKAEEPLTGLADRVEVKTPTAFKEVAGGFTINPEAGSASKRLKIRAVAAGMNQQDLYYVRPEDVEDEEVKGGKVVTEGVKSWANPEGKGVHRITRRGQDELILMHMKNRNQKQAQEIQGIGSAITASIDSSAQRDSDRIPGAVRGARYRDGDADFQPVE